MIKTLALFVALIVAKTGTVAEALDTEYIVRVKFVRAWNREATDTDLFAMASAKKSSIEEFGGLDGLLEGLDVEQGFPCEKIAVETLEERTTDHPELDMQVRVKRARERTLLEGATLKAEAVALFRTKHGINAVAEEALEQRIENKMYEKEKSFLESIGATSPGRMPADSMPTQPYPRREHDHQHDHQHGGPYRFPGGQANPRNYHGRQAHERHLEEAGIASPYRTQW